MTAAGPPDNELVSTYVTQGSESAFGVLVSRHVDMVFATAFRLTGDAALAEEITQNVFIMLARKAPRLAGYQTLGGWLFRAVVLETRRRVRGELRRHRREETASALLNLQREGTSASAALLPLLDEALWSLRQADRLALVTRFLEESSYREVGLVLGVDEEAARKRVTRALDKVSAFFKQRGFSVPATGGAAAVLTAAVQAAPRDFAASVSQAALATADSAGGINTLLIHFLKLSARQLAAACVVCAVIPLVWQHAAQAARTRQQAALESLLAAAARRADALEANIAKTEEAAAQVRTETTNARVELSATEFQLANPAARPRYHWDDSSSYARVPKDVLSNKRWFAISTKSGDLSDEIKQRLQMTKTEADQVQQAVFHLLSTYGCWKRAGSNPPSPPRASWPAMPPPRYASLTCPTSAPTECRNYARNSLAR